MAGPVVTNWFGDLVSHPREVVEAISVEDIVAVIRNPETYPSPVRAVASNHSTARCGVAEGGTRVQQTMDGILNHSTNTVTVEAGKIYIDIANEPEKRQLQLYVNTENWQPFGGERGVRGHERRFHARRVRPGRLIY